MVPISLGTGTKTTPFESLKGTPGDVLHDLHAEVLARRGARRWLAQRIALETQCEKRGEPSSGGILDGIPPILVRDPETQSWKLKEGIKVWWYVSTLPCESRVAIFKSCCLRQLTSGFSSLLQVENAQHPHWRGVELERMGALSTQ